MKHRAAITLTALTLLLAGCGGGATAADKPAHPTAEYLSIIRAAEATANGTDRTDQSNPYNATMDKADLKIAHTACKALDKQPEKVTYRALIQAATTDNNTALGKLRVDAAIGAFCPEHLNLKG